MILYRSKSRRIFEVFLYSGLVLFSLAIIFPFLHVLAISLSSKKAILQGRVYFWPVEIVFKAYQVILSSNLFLTSMRNTVFITMVNTTLCITFSVCAGYALANKNFYGLKIAIFYILIPLYFTGGLIPLYIIVNRYGLNNTIAALVFPNLTRIFYIIIFRNAINQVPKEITESAEIDGASEYTILFRIVYPLIKPMVMAFTIFSAVAYWNEWWYVLLFIRDKSKWTLQYMLRDIYSNPLLGGGQLDGIIDDPTALLPANLIMAAIICTVVPIIIIYPFLQKYFIHGIIVGAVKG